MSVTYGTSTLPSDIITVRQQSSTAVSVGFDAVVCLVGGYDPSNGSVSASDLPNSYTVTSGSEAANLFGTDSELHYQTELAFANGAAEVEAVPVPETTGSVESFASTSSGTLSNAPAFDPNVHPEHDITAQDTVAATSVTVNIVYTDSPSTPSSSDTINLNPINGKWTADESSDYDITYDYGDYSTAISEADTVDARVYCILTEDDSLGSTATTDAENRATDFDFSHVVFGAVPEDDPSNPSPGTYQDSVESPRAVVVAPSRGTVDQSDQTYPRTFGAVAGAIAGSPIVESTTLKNIRSVSSLRTDYTPSEIQNFGDAEYSETDTVLGVLPLIDRGGVEIVVDRTASNGTAFRDLYKHEIVDDLAYSIHLVAKDFVGEHNTPEARRLDLESPVRNVLRSASNQRPPMLATGDGSTPYTVTVSTGATDKEVDLAVGLDVVDVAKTVDVDINVGDVVTFDGASA